MEKICVRCENGSSLTIRNILIEGSEFSAEVSLKSDWYEASLPFVSSQNRLFDFLNDLKKVLLENQGKATFINDEGTFDLEVSFDQFTGKVQIAGVLIKDMMDESRLEYCMQSDYLSLNVFRDNLSEIIPRVN